MVAAIKSEPRPRSGRNAWPPYVGIRATEIVFQDGTPVEMQGDWIPADEATAGEDDPGLPVLHFTHRPVGFVRYEGEQYE